MKRQTSQILSTSQQEPVRSSSLGSTTSHRSATLPTESTTLTATPKATLISPKTTVDASTQWCPGTEDQSIEGVVGGNVVIENKSINGDQIEPIGRKETGPRQLENLGRKDNDIIAGAKNLADASTDHPEEAVTGSNFPEGVLDPEHLVPGSVHLEEVQFPPCPQSFYVPLEVEESTDMKVLSGKADPCGETNETVFNRPQQQELHERQFSNDSDELDFTQSMPEFLNYPQLLCLSPSSDPSEKKMGFPNDTSTTSTTTTAAITATKGCPPEFDKIKQLIEAKRKVREKKDQRSKAVSYFYDINHSDTADIDVCKNTLNNFDDNFNSDCLTADLSPDNSLNSTAFNLFERSCVAVPRTRAKSNNHSATSSESDSSSCSSYYTDCKETASQESLTVASLKTSFATLPDILENAASLSEESKMVVKDFLFFGKHLPQTMATLSEESDKEACEDEVKEESNSGVEEVMKRTDYCAESTLNEPQFEKNVKKCVDEINTSQGGSDYNYSSHSDTSTPNLQDKERNRTPSTNPELHSTDLTTVRKKLFGRMNSDNFQSTAFPGEDKQHLSRSLSDCPSADQNSRSARQRVETRLPHLHNYSHNLAQLSSVMRYRYKPLASKTDSHSSQDSYEDSLFQSPMTGSLDRLASAKELGIARRRNYNGPRLMTYAYSHRHSEIPNSDSPTCEAYFRPAPRPIPKVALAKLNEDGTPKSILKKKARFVQDISADKRAVECSTTLGC